MSKNKIRRKKASRPLDRLIGEHLARVRFSGDRLLELYRLKTLAHPEQFRIYQAVFAGKGSLDPIHGPAFPRKATDLFSKTGFGFTSPVFNEIIWACSRV